jgi:hypothetical protein
MTLRRAWDGDSWQAYALQLVQIRHQPQNVQIVPDRVKGDAGVEFFSTNGCLYQCYAPEETADVAKASSAMKAKASRDLQKLNTYAAVIEKILQGIKCARWILLCPFLDDKEVVAFVRHKGKELQALGLSFVDPHFEALVHSQSDFTTEIDHLKQLSAGLPLHFPRPTDADVQAQPDGEMTLRLRGKLLRAFPNSTPGEIEKRKGNFIRAHLTRENALYEMRDNHPILWEQSRICIDAEENRLLTIGAGSGAPVDQLDASVTRIERSLARDLPTVAASVVTEIAVGTISDWLLRCPLDFPEEI